MKRLWLTFFCTGMITWLVAQNIAITDDESYSANPSAMLDVKSITKGMLVPRVTSIQRMSITNPATGLLVFDSNLLAFYYFNGTTWINLSTPADNPWSTSTSGIYLTNTGFNMGIGTLSSSGKLEIQGDGSGGADELLLVVKNVNGDTVFAVYNGGVRIYVDDTPSKGSGSRGGFAVGGISSSKGTFTNEFLRVTPDSVRIYVQDAVPGKATGSRGGFAVGGISSSKGLLNEEYLRVTTDSVRVYVPSGNAKGTGSRGGFAVGGITSSKTIGEEFMQMTKDNYFIGLGAGANNSDGLYNSFMGYQAGYKNQHGDRNIFLGYQAGFNNIGGLLTSPDSVKGDRNIFLGFEAGQANTYGFDNVFLGTQSGKFNTTGDNNILIGNFSGYSLTTGIHNILFGSSAGYSHTSEKYNVMIGTGAGYCINAGFPSGSYNTFVGINAGRFILHSRENTFIGTNAGYYVENGEGNTFVGIDAGRSGYSEHHFGYSLYNNTFIGDKSGYLITTGSGNVFLGYQAGFNETTNSNRLYIENSNASSASALIYGEFDTNVLRFNARVGIGTVPDVTAALNVNGTVKVSENVTATNITATTLTGNVSGNVTGNVTGMVNGIDMGKIYLTSDAPILTCDMGKIILYWDKSHDRIKLINQSHDYCSFWYTVHRDNLIESNAKFVENDSEVDICTLPKASLPTGLEIHFGTGVPGADWASVWLQFIEGNLWGHYMK